MEIDFTPQERFEKIITILAEGTLNLIACSNQFAESTYLTFLRITDLRLESAEFLKVDCYTRLCIVSGEKGRLNLKETTSLHIPQEYVLSTTLEGHQEHNK